MLEALKERFPDEPFLEATDLDEAVIGVDEQTMRLIYSVTKVVEIYVAQGMTEEEAIEYFYYNPFRAGVYYGDKAPIWCMDLI